MSAAKPQAASRSSAGKHNEHQVVSKASSPAPRTSASKVTSGQLPVRCGYLSPSMIKRHWCYVDMAHQATDIKGRYHTWPDVSHIEAGCAVLAIDGPVHGLRQIEPGGREALAVEMQRPTYIDDMVAEWLVAVSAIRSVHGLNGPTGYFGLSMGTIFGLPLLAQGEIDFAASAIGLAGSTRAGRSFGERLLADAARVSHPVAFLMQLEDELFDRDGYLALFDALASTDKRLHANPGLHPEVPAEEIAFVFEFLQARL